MQKLTTYYKLVRDEIPKIIAKEGKTVRYTTLQGDALKEALKAKLLEEVQEFIKAETPAQQIEELADILTVLDAINHVFDIKTTEVAAAIDTKAHSHGWFYDGCFLIAVEEDEDDQN